MSNFLKILFLLFIFFFFSTAYLWKSDPYTRHAQRILETQLKAVKAAVRAQNWELLVKLFNLESTSSADFTKAFEFYKRYNFRIKSVRFLKPSEILANVSMVAYSRKPAKELEFQLNSNRESPTGWKIMEAWESFNWW